MSIEKMLKVAISLVAVFILSYLLYQKMQPTPHMAEQTVLEKLPRFKFPRIGAAGHVSNGDLRKGKTVVVYFSPNCEHCQQLGADIGMQRNQLADIDFVFVTRMEEADAILYAQKCNLWEKPNIHFGLDVDAVFYGYFGDMFIPSSYIFNEKGKFLQSVHQKAMVKDILDVYAGKPSDKNKTTR